MDEPKKVSSIAKELIADESLTIRVDKDDKPRVICQVNLTSIRCGSCSALLARATSGSVVGIVCHRCKTYNFVEVSK